MIEGGHENDYLYARDGDSLICPFECDDCAFTRLTRRIADRNNERDKTLLMCIRRANLDAFWSGKPNTVSGSVREFKYHREVSARARMDFVPFRHAEAWPVDVSYGLEYAISMLWKSLEPGRHEPTAKFNTVRKVRAMASNVEEVLRVPCEIGRMIKYGRKATVLESPLPSDSQFLRRFMRGMMGRMGQRLRQDLALTPEVVVGVLDICNDRWTEARRKGNVTQARREAEVACFFVLTYAVGLRGFEVPKVILRNFRNQIVREHSDDLPPHVGVPLYGFFKCREGVKMHMVMFLALETDSGVQTELWLTRMLDILEEDGVSAGWMFQDARGRQRRQSYFKEGFYERLMNLKETRGDLFMPEVEILEDYGPTRSGRRGTNTRALKKVRNEKLVELFFRWNTGGDETSCLSMPILYAQRLHMLDEFLRISKLL